MQDIIEITKEDFEDAAKRKTRKIAAIDHATKEMYTLCQEEVSYTNFVKIYKIYDRSEGFKGELAKRFKELALKYHPDKHHSNKPIYNLIFQRILSYSKLNFEKIWTLKKKNKL